METVSSVAVVGPLEESVKSTPMPASEVVCVLEGALSAKVIVPAMGPGVDGEKTICKAQAVLMASDAPQVLVAMLKPVVMAMLVRVSGRPPLLVSVSV